MPEPRTTSLVASAPATSHPSGLTGLERVAASCLLGTGAQSKIDRQKCLEIDSSDPGRDSNPRPSGYEPKTTSSFCTSSELAASSTTIRLTRTWPRLTYNPTAAGANALWPQHSSSRMKFPAYETIDHFGVTVPDLDIAVEFFVQRPGCRALVPGRPIRDPDGDSMRSEMHVHSRSIERLAMLRVSSTATIELLEFSRDGETDRDAPDLTGHSVAHIGLRVSDLDSAVLYLRQAEGVEVLSWAHDCRKRCRRGPALDLLPHSMGTADGVGRVPSGDVGMSPAC